MRLVVDVAQLELLIYAVLVTGQRHILCFNRNDYIHGFEN
jgi:hypothetical protein